MSKFYIFHYGPLIITLHDVFLLFSIANFAIGDDITDSMLHFNKVQKRQYGEYICRASNIFGTAEATIILFGK